MQLPQPPQVPDPPKRLVRKGRFWKTVNGADSGAFWNAIILLLWGTWLLMPADSFSVSRAFHVMESLAPEWVWGGSMVVTGSVAIAGVRSGSEELTWGAMWLAALSFLVLTVAFASSELFSTATIVYGALGIRCLFLTRKYAGWFARSVR